MATDTKTTETVAPVETEPAGNDKALVAATAGQHPAVRPPMDFNPDDPVALYMNTGVFEQLQRVARMMASAAAVPAHLRDKIADCFLVAAQAFRWRMDPFAVAQGTYVVSGKLGYEGKLVAAVINSHKAIEEKLDYAYSGAGAERKVVVSASLRGEKKVRTIEGTVGQWATENPKWKSMTDQMLAYRGAREWARRHAPEILLGVSTEDEIRETVTLAPQGDGTFAAPGGSKALDALTERVEAQRASEAPAETTATAAAEPAPEKAVEAHPADAEGAEREPAKAAGGMKPAVEPEADPRTPEGNPFLRQAEKVRRGQKSLSE